LTPPRSHRHDESWRARLARRAVTIPLCLGLGAAVWAALPAMLVLAGTVDVLRRARWLATRCVLFFAAYLACEVGGIAAAAALWSLDRTAWRRRPARSQDAHRRLQACWARALFACGRRLFGFRLVVEPPMPATTGPLVVFIRHASVADTLLPTIVLADGAGLRLRYVLKRELLRDPCLDLVGQRLPNVFVRRDSRDARAEADAVATLLDDAGADDAVLIYPEGTRCTPAKRARLLRRLAEQGDPAALARAQALRCVLPPRPGGPLALLEHRARPDVLFVAHHGFDAAATFWDFWNGALLGRTIRVAVWRVSHEEVPADRAKRLEWLDEQWLRVDAWVAARRAEDGS
jgi:1-acyl-sn-glycerol-3-phosphate acyltransferase